MHSVLYSSESPDALWYQCHLYAWLHKFGMQTLRCTICMLTVTLQA